MKYQYEFEEWKRIRSERMYWWQSDPLELNCGKFLWRAILALIAILGVVGLCLYFAPFRMLIGIILGVIVASMGYAWLFDWLTNMMGKWWVNSGFDLWVDLKYAIERKWRAIREA